MLKKSHNENKSSRYTDIETRKKILELHNQGYKQREIARSVYVSVSTVNFWINKYGHLDSRKRTGRIRKTTKEQDDDIYSASIRNPFLPATDINRQLHLNICAQTIRNRLLERGLKNFKAPQKPLLTESRKMKRLEFAYKYENWSADKWENLCFADEKTFQSFGNGFTRVWRPKLSRWNKQENAITRFHESVISTHNQSGRFSIPIWGCIGKINHIHLIKVKHLNKEYFKNNILDKYFPKEAEDFIFAHDNSPIHTAKIVQNWFQQNNIQVLDWPAYSPDLNPIENLWGRMEYLTRDRRPTSNENLWDIVKEAYDKITADKNYIKNLMRSMPNRLKDVIKVKGNVTKY